MLHVDCGDKRKFCRPDFIFINNKRGAVVELKNYEKKHLSRAQVRKTYYDMRALENTMECKVSKTFIIKAKYAVDTQTPRSFPFQG